MPTLAASKRKAGKRPDPLIHKRRPTSLQADGQRLATDTRRKSKATLGSRSLGARKEALKKKLQNRQDATKRTGERKIGGATFLTQRDDEEEVEMVEDFIARNRGVAQALLTFRSSRKAAPRQTVQALPKKHAATARSHPRPPHARVGVPFARASGMAREPLGDGRLKPVESLSRLEISGNLLLCTWVRLEVEMNTSCSGSFSSQDALKPGSLAGVLLQVGEI